MEAIRIRGYHGTSMDIGSGQSGRLVLERYQQMEEKVAAYAQQLMDEAFPPGCGLCGSNT